jgi:hypothetical protein
MHHDDAKPLSEERIREKIADYRRSSEAARRKAGEATLPQIRDSYLRLAEGFDKLVADLERALKQRLP